MAKRILILPETITNKIAAGEVVERPASVVKELVENALDAEATDITISVTGGGRRLLSITDNGLGMSRDDALLALERHATSKIRSDQDLERILTLGFRGEALPSIASVSRFRLATRERGSIEGTEIYVEGGRVRDVRSCGMAPGTTITVEQLFFNTPARLKFLKSAETEAGHIADTVARMAVSRPDVAFTLESYGRELIRVQRSDLQRRLAQTVGRDAAAGVHELCWHHDGLNIAGFISGPSVVRSTTAAIYTYINGRFVRDRVVQHAIMQAYRGVIDRGRYPVLALFIELPPGDVDVNVHPTKHEVRFRRQSQVHDGIYEAISNLLGTSPWLKRTVAALPGTLSTAESSAYRERIAAAAQAALALPRGHDRQIGSFSYPPDRGTCISTQETAETPSVHERPAPPFQSDPPEHTGYFSSLSIIGQFHGEYILCQAGSDLVIIDQHAASERVAFQRLKGQHLAGGIESQRLLFTETVELTHGEIAVAARFQKELAGIGFELEPFGGTTLLMSAHPRLVPEPQASLLLRDLLADLTKVGVMAAFESLLDDLFARIACHSVVRGVHTLEHRQISELLRAMDQTEFAASCPHGRPVSHVITVSELEKIFKRS